MHPRLPHLRNVLLAATGLLALGVARVTAGPEGGTVVDGAATIQSQGSASVVVNQSTPSAIINWNTFNIGVNEKVLFNQPSSSAVALNRVTGGLGPSQIMGTLTANGRIFLINRDGILFGPGSVVNTAGFLATTNDIKNSDFMAGRYNFNIPGRPDASIVNQGKITATSGGFAALVAPGVRNSGTITATLGTVALAAGNSFTLDMYGDKLITLAVNDQIASKVIDVATGKPLKSLVTNDGKIRANGGRVELTAAAARTVVDSVINTSGVIKANAVGHRAGMIVLTAATGASKPAGAPAQTIKIAGTLAAAGKHKGTKGGTIVVSGEHIKVANARIDASGRAGGGKVLIGGDWAGGKPNKSLVNNPIAKLESFAIPTATTVSVDAGTTINASATRRGNSGKVILWSDTETTFSGTILARGGAQGGDGGFVEVSSHRLLNYSGTTDTRAPKGSVGTLLLDPFDVLISAQKTQNGSITGGTFTPTGAPSVLSKDDLNNALNLSNVIVTTGGANSPGSQTGDITFDHGAQIIWHTGTTLTLSAYHSIIFETGSAIKNDAKGNLVLRADNSGIGSGTVIFQSNGESQSGRVDFSQSTGTVSIFYNPSSYQNPTIFSCSGSCSTGGVLVNQNQPSQLTAYMLVNNVIDLQKVSTNVGGTYALGRDIDASSIPNFTPIANFAGLFDGKGQTIANLTIASTAQNVGLFGSIGNTGVVRNLNLADVTVSGLGSQFVGTLAGTNAGTISNVFATDVAVSVGSNGNGGGLVGLNSGTITNAFASGDVTGAAGTNGFTTLGGFAAVNLGSISNSFASVDVGSPDTANLQAGGLVGNNAGAILSSFATGQVQGGAGSTAGGLVALNAGTIGGATAPALTQPCVAGQTCATGAVSVGSNGIGGGLVGSNSGTITNAFATGDVTGAAGIDGFTTLGGLAAVNLSSISNSFASGDVGSPTVANLQAGGLIGDNSGTILSSTALGNVQTGDTSFAGGLVASNSVNGTIIGSQASGNITVASASVAGGLVGDSAGTITDSTASGAVSGTGTNSTAGGLVGILDGGTITGSQASGDVTVSTASVAGGLVGVNNGGTISADSTASGTVTGTGSGNILGGQVGVVVGSTPIPPSAGDTTSGTATSLTPATLLPPFSSEFLASLSAQQAQTSQNLGNTISPELLALLSAQQAAQQAQVSQNLGSTVQLAAFSTAPVFNTVQGGIRLPPQQLPSPVPGGQQQSPSPAPAGQQQLPSGFARRVIDVPPPTETRFIKDEVVMQIAGNTSVARLQAAVGRLGLTLLASENLAIIGSTVARFRITNGRSPAEIIRALAAIQLVAVAQPNYVYALQQESAASVPTSRGEAAQVGDAAQYILDKLKISDVHRMVRGTNVPIAVIDSDIDVTHPELEGAVAQRFDAVGAPDKPHPHGTGMAGAIAAHQRLLGTAPASRLLAVHAFSTGAASAESTTFNILRGINWSAQEGARIINMSFAGPKDPSLERALKAAYDKGIVLVAAAGNAGPKSPPLFPAAVPYVIAVTATDVEDKLFAGANRGKYISVAAPGVDILVPAPENSYQLTTGTSVAAAEVSGIVALLLERNPKLTPADIRRILTSSAKRLSPGERDNDFGSGLIDPLKALQLADPRTAVATPPPAPKPAQR